MMTEKWKLDPTGHFTGRGVKKTRMLPALGIVPMFVSYAAENAKEATERAVLDAMAEAYGFYMGDMKGGSVDAEGVYSYPEDPDMYPLIEWTLGQDIKVTMYQYAIVAVRGPNETIVTRMD